MKALVTGGNGFLGRFVVEALRRRGDSVRVLSRTGSDPETPDVESLPGDLRDADAVSRAAEGVDCIFHAAAYVGPMWGDRLRYMSINVDGTRNVIDACRRHGVRKMVFTSSSSVVFHMADEAGIDESRPYPGRYYSPYAETKSMAERLVLAANGPELMTCALRPHFIWGPRDNHLTPSIIGRARRGRLAQVGSGNNLIDITYVENAAHAHVLAVDALSPGSAVCGRAYFISDGEPVRLWQWINELLLGVSAPPVERRIPYRVAYGMGFVSEILCTLFPWLGEPRLTRYLASVMATSQYFNLDRARRDLNYRPIVNRAEAMRRTIDWFRAH
jgi:nucleoside-diphosphate-sugar epimerase